MEYGKTKLIHLLKNVPQEGWTVDKIKDTVDSLWRDRLPVRWSGFETAGGPDAVISFDNVTRKFKIEPDDKIFSYYQFRTRLSYHIKATPEEIQIEDIEGVHLIYYDQDEETLEQKLHVIANPTEAQIREIYLHVVIVSWLYWTRPGNGIIYFGDERHGSEWPSQVHWWAHRAFNAIRESGLRITDITYGDGSQDADAQFGVSAGVFLHEDMEHEVDAVLSTAGLPILYRWANAGVWPRFLSNNAFPVQPTGDGLIYFNTNSGQLLPADDDTYVLCHVFASNCRINEVFAVMGQTQYSSLRDAFAGAQAELDEILSWMPHQTRLHISTLVYHTSFLYTNTPNARIVAEVTPESLAEVVAEDVVPYVKTGWSPQVQEEILFGFKSGTRRLTLDIQKAEVPYFVKGKSMKLTSDVLLTIADTTGLHYLTAGQYTFESVQNRWDEYTANYAYISAIYWNARQQYACHVGWRMHLWEMEPKTRGNILKKTGLERVSGFGITINDAEGMEHTIHVEEGTLRLADITVNVADGGGGNHRQQLTPLEARRYYLKTYVDDTDPENPVITHEWEYQSTPLVNIAKLSAANEVEINEFAEGAWMLTETTDGDYTAMWLIGTLCSEQPLKWITGQFASADLDEAKQLNSPETLRNVLLAAPLLDYKDVLARVMIKNIADEPYYELIEIREYDEGEFDAETKDRHVIDMTFDDITRELSVIRNANLPVIKVTIPGESTGGGGDPEPGQDGREIELSVESGYIVWRYIGDLTWINLISVEAITGPPGEGEPGNDGREIELSTSGGNVVWRYVGDSEWIVLFAIPEPGIDGKQIELRKNAGWVEWRYVGDSSWTQLYEIPEGGGGADVPPELHLDFSEAGDDYIYNVPYDMKFTSQVSENTDAELDIAINTIMPRYTKLKVTATATGLVSLYGEYV